jgi:hypothetical protein
LRQKVVKSGFVGSTKIAKLQAKQHKWQDVCMDSHRRRQTTQNGMECCSYLPSVHFDADFAAAMMAAWMLTQQDVKT